MKILFDFDNFTDPYVNLHLSDIMLAMKAECLCLLAPYYQKIFDDGGMVLVTLKPDRVALKYHYSSDTATSDKVQAILEEFDWDGIIQRYAKISQN